MKHFIKAVLLTALIVLVMFALWWLALRVSTLIPVAIGTTACMLCY